MPSPEPVRSFEQLVKDVGRLRARADKMWRLQKDLLVERLLRSSRYSDPRHLCRFEAHVYSQHGEDGIIAEILRRIGTTNRCFVEIGAEDGAENNTRYLLSKGWRGFWFEAAAEHVRTMTTTHAHAIARDQLQAVHAWLTAENALSTLLGHQVPSGCDVLSIDIDRNTSHVWRALVGLQARMAVIEYNAAIPPDDEWEVEYDPNAIWDGSVYYGAGLRTLQTIGSEHGYTLVGCELSGTNAFFVRSDLLNDQFAAPLTVADLYEPPRYYLNGDWGHVRRNTTDR